MSLSRWVNEEFPSRASSLVPVFSMRSRAVSCWAMIGGVGNRRSCMCLRVASRCRVLVSGRPGLFLFAFPVSSLVPSQLPSRLRLSPLPCLTAFTPEPALALVARWVSSWDSVSVLRRSCPPAGFRRRGLLTVSLPFGGVLSRALPSGRFGVAGVGGGSGCAPVSMRRGREAWGGVLSAGHFRFWELLVIDLLRKVMGMGRG